METVVSLEDVVFLTRIPSLVTGHNLIVYSPSPLGCLSFVSKDLCGSRRR